MTTNGLHHISLDLDDLFSIITATFVQRLKDFGWHKHEVEAIRDHAGEAIADVIEELQTAAASRIHNACEAADSLLGNLEAMTIARATFAIAGVTLADKYNRQRIAESN